MILSGHQPVYLPGIILFNKIALSDAFMFVGHCQYSPKSWQTRNYIRGSNGPQMLSIPVQKSLGQSINETKFAGDNWRRKHLRAIELAYRRRPFFFEYFPIIEHVCCADWGNLSALNCALITRIMFFLQIKTPVLFSDSLQITGQKTGMLISMCKAACSTEYLSNEGARDYVDEQKMGDAGIKHRWQKFTHPVYDQGHKEFIPNLSIIDLLFNCGPDSGRIVRECGYVD